jgi:hypothetical protein
VEYTVDQFEKSAISQIVGSGLLGQIMSVHLASAPAVAGVMPVRAMLHDEEQDPSIKTAELLALSVFDDADLTIPSVDVALSTPIEGTLLLGAGTGLVVVRTSNTGVFACSATCPTPGVTRYLASDRTTGSGILDCRMVRTLVYP